MIKTPQNLQNFLEDSFSRELMKKTGVKLRRQFLIKNIFSVAMTET